jgi:hypothetical protein
MAQLDVIDQSTVRTLVTQARDCLMAGDEKHAARLLTDAVYSTHDPEIERQIRDLAEQGLEQAGRFGKGRWAEIIRIAELRAQRA